MHLHNFTLEGHRDMVNLNPFARPIVQSMGEREVVARARALAPRFPAAANCGPPFRAFRVKYSEVAGRPFPNDTGESRMRKAFSLAWVKSVPCPSWLMMFLLAIVLVFFAAWLPSEPPNTLAAQ